MTGHFPVPDAFPNSLISRLYHTPGMPFSVLRCILWVKEGERCKGKGASGKGTAGKTVGARHASPGLNRTFRHWRPFPFSRLLLCSFVSPTQISTAPFFLHYFHHYCVSIKPYAPPACQKVKRLFWRAADLFFRAVSKPNSSFGSFSCQRKDTGQKKTVISTDPEVRGRPEGPAQRISASWKRIILIQPEPDIRFP